MTMRSKFRLLLYLAHNLSGPWVIVSLVNVLIHRPRVQESRMRLAEVCDAYHLHCGFQLILKN
jgi:hypothetical protein